MATGQSFQTLDAAATSFSEEQTNGLSAGQYTQPFSIVPFYKPYALGQWMKFNVVLTASGPATPASGTDVIDLIFSDLQVSGSVGGETRCEALTRPFAEFVWTFCTDTNPNVAAAPTFASAGTASVTIYLYVPLGGAAASTKLKLPQAPTGVYSSGVSIAFTSVKSYVVSSNFSGVVAFQEQNTASLGTALQSMLTYIPGGVAPDAMFMKGESSSTITQVTLITVSGVVLAQTTDTDINQIGASFIANTAGPTYTTSAGFVFTGDGEAFRTFQLAFANATTHFLGYVQIGGGQSEANPNAPQPTPAPSAVQIVGSVNSAGQVTAVSATGPTTVSKGLLNTTGSAGALGAIISRRIG